MFTLTGCVMNSNGINSVTTPNPPAYSNTLNAFGDSITLGNDDSPQDGITFPNQLASMSGWTVNNYGIGGQTSSQIAVRLNAYASTPHQTFPIGFTIPTSGSVTCAFQSGFEPAYLLNLYNSGAVYPNGIPIQTTVSGTAYNLYVTYNSGPGTYVCTPASNPESPVAVPSSNAYTVVTGNLLNTCVGLEAGSNDVGGPQVLANTAAVVAAVTAAQGSNACYYVMSVFNSEKPTTWKGTSYYSDVMSINSTLATLYGTHYIDARSNLVASYNPSNTADVADYANDVIPTSLRAQDVGGTITSAIPDTSTCAITFSTGLPMGYVAIIENEAILLTNGTNGAYTCIRGFSGTAETHASGVAYSGISFIHPGTNKYSAANPYCTNGYICMAKQVNQWLLNNVNK